MLSKFLINILRPNLPFSRSLPLYRKKQLTSDEENIEEGEEKEGDQKEGAGNEEEGGGEDGEGGGVGINLDPKRRISLRERRRYRTTNIWVPDFTGEKPMHAWMDNKKFKSLGSIYEQLRNTHRFTIKIEEKDRKNIGKKTVELTEWKVPLLSLINFLLFSFKKVQRNHGGAVLYKEIPRKQR